MVSKGERALMAVSKAERGLEEAFKVDQVAAAEDGGVELQ